MFRSEEDRKVTLTEAEGQHILAVDSAFQTICEAAHFDNYNLPCPIRVRVSTKDQQLVTVVLRETRHGDIRKEVQMLRALKEYGLPVPEVLAEPFETERRGYAAIYSLLPGENLQTLSMRSDRDLLLAKDLLGQAVIQLMDATNFIRSHEVSKIVPSITLMDELEAVDTKDNPWLTVKLCCDGIQALRAILPDIETRLVVSNGDYQPGNFLAQDGKITGFLDFESPSFQDPLMGFVKYPVYGLYPLARTDLIKTVLNAKGFSEEEFNHRLALGCLKILKQEIPVSGSGEISGSGENAREYRHRVLSLLRKAIGAS